MLKGDILIRGVNWVGDAVMSMPAISAIRRAAPTGARISLLVKPWVAPLFEHNPMIDEIIHYEKHHDGIFGKIALAYDLRQRGFGSAVLLQNALDAAILAWLSRIPTRIGYVRDGRGVFLSRPVPFHGEDRAMHHIDYYMRMLMKAGVISEIEARSPAAPWIFLQTDERIKARELLSGLRRPIIGLNPGAAYGSAKQWLPDRFAATARAVAEELGGSAVIFGGPGELDVASEILLMCPDHAKAGSVMNMAGKTTLRELAALISECDAFVSNDSGPMHMAYALKTPLVAIFGSTSAELTGPRGPGSIVLSREVGCNPCFERTCKGMDMRCMKAIEVNDVTGAIKRLLPTKKAVFFDRDGTLCVDAHYLNNWDKLDIFSDIAEIQRLKDSGYLIIGVTNQSGISRGIVDERFVCDVNRHFMDKYGFDEFYYCPHHPDFGCSCRKPEPGILMNAKVEHGINLKRSFVVGDKDADMLLAVNAGSHGILVKTGKQMSSEHAQSTATNLKEAVEIIIREGL